MGLKRLRKTHRMDDNPFREEDFLAENDEPKDVSQKNAIIKNLQDKYKVIEYNFSKPMIKLGSYITHTMFALLKKLGFSLKRVKNMLGDTVSSVWQKGKSWFTQRLKNLTKPFKEKAACAEDIKLCLHKAKKQGKKAFALELVKSLKKFYSGIGKAISTSFNYAAPIISIAFLIGIVNYTSNLEYGLSVKYNGQQLGIINQESDFNTAAREVQKRISYVDGEEEVKITPQFSLKIIDNQDQYVDVNQLADKMISSSDAELTNASGIYIDGEFIGAVKNKETIMQALSDMLASYNAEGTVKDVRFQKSVDYRDGVYLAESVTDEKTVIDKLQSKTTKPTTYTVADDDTLLVISKKCNMSQSDLVALNPGIDKALKPGTVIKVNQTVSYMPIEYTRVLQTTTYINYGSKEVATSDLYEGRKEVIKAGQKGERTNLVDISYVDGFETARNTISSEVTKQPVTEEIGVGTYTAKPSSSSTVLCGSGQFSWPVDGGYISDPFMSDRNHKGMDIAASTGTQIYAAADGVVTSAGWNSGGYGNWVTIDNGNGYVTVYAHMSSVAAVEGEQVTKGQLIGFVGSTGDSTGSHCHFEVRLNGICHNPADYISVNN